MIVSSMQASQSNLPITHNLVTHSIAPVKLHPNNSPYPLQLSTVHVPVQIPGSTSNINVPVQISGPTNTVPLQIAPVSLPLQVSGTTSVPVQLPAGETINVPLQIPTANPNIQLPTLPSMPVLQNHNQSLHSSIIQVHMGSTNPRSTNMDCNSEMTVPSSSHLQISETTISQVKVNNPLPQQVQVAHNNAMLQMQNAANSIQIRGAPRQVPHVPHVVYIQTPTGLKPVSSTDVITQASTSGNPPQIIVRRPVSESSPLTGIHVTIGAIMTFNKFLVTYKKVAKNMKY